MLLLEFEYLDIEEKLDRIQENGEVISKRTDGKHSIDLWRLYDFYVEIFYDIKNDALIKLKTTDNENVVKEYLN